MRSGVQGRRTARCPDVVVLLAYGAARCDLTEGHDGDHDTSAFDADIWPDESVENDADDAA